MEQRALPAMPDVSTVAPSGMRRAASRAVRYLGPASGQRWSRSCFAQVTRQRAMWNSNQARVDRLRGTASSACGRDILPRFWG